MPRFLKAPQGSEEWFNNRAGHATASRFIDILAGKGARDAYLWELVGERLAGPSRDAGGKAKDWGSNAEDLARQRYSIITGEMVREVGFAVHSKIMWCGASSDGLLVSNPRRGIEIKSPFNSGIHARTLAKGMPEIHFAQTQGNLWVLEMDQIDFLSYDPAFPDPFDLYIEPQKRDEKFIKHLEGEVKKFLAEVAVAVRDIKSKHQ